MGDIVKLTDKEYEHLKKIHKHIHNNLKNVLKHKTKEIYLKNSGMFGIALSEDNKKYSCTGVNLIMVIDNLPSKVTDWKIYKINKAKAKQ